MREIGHGCCRLDGCYSRCGPVLTVTCSCEWNIKQCETLSYTTPTFNQCFFTDCTCPDRIASLINSHLGADMQWDFRLLACGCLSCCCHSCRLGMGRYSIGAHSEGLVEIRPWNNGSKVSRRGADNGDSSPSLSAQTHGHFGLGVP